MKRKRGATGLALLAICVFGAVTASAATAAAEFEVVGGGTATYIGQGINGVITQIETPQLEFQTKALLAKCSTASYHGGGTGGPEMKLTFTYTGCTIAGVKITVDTYGCYYLTTAKATQNGLPQSIEAANDLVCPNNKLKGEHVEVTVNVGCTVTIPPQNFTNPMEVLDRDGGAGTAMDIRSTLDAVNVQYEYEGTLCGGGVTTNKLTEDGTLKGVSTIQGQQQGGGSAVGLTVG